MPSHHRDEVALISTLHHPNIVHCVGASVRKNAKTKSELGCIAFEQISQARVRLCWKGQT